MSDLASRLRVTAEIAPDADTVTKLLPAARDALREAADEIKRLRLFRDQVAKAAGDLEGLPDGHAFEIIWSGADSDGIDIDPDYSFITAGMIRRADGS